jgi:(p)ppGpp synthase/HD superfamily hydrolase
MLNHIRRFLKADYWFVIFVESWMEVEDHERVLAEFVKVKNALNGVNRLNSDRAISHPRNSAIIYILYCAETRRLQITGDAIIIILYHDFIEDMSDRYSFQSIAREKGKAIARGVYYCTKPKYGLGEKFLTREESDKKFYHLLSRTPDENVGIKLAERVENLLTLNALSPERRKRNIVETESYLLPLARERGIMVELFEKALAVAKSYK